MVSEEARGSELVDPLEGYSGLSLFPKALWVLPDHSKPYDQEADLEAIHKHLKSMALRSPGKLVEQAKMIVDGNSEILSSEMMNYGESKEKNEELKVKAKENPPERRPALNRKRARFSLKPNSSQPSVNLEPTLDIKPLKDPEEFFLAYERFENAQREIQKQRGGTLKDLGQKNPSPTTRQRRPGLLGRSVTYKHQYSSTTAQNDGNVVSQDMIEQDILSPSNLVSQQETNENADLQEMELVSSITETENKVNKILNGLLSVDCDDLDGDGAVNMLQIKPMELDKFPDFQDIRTSNLTFSRGNLPKNRNALSDIENLFKGMTSLKHRQEVECSIHHLASPTPPKSPFASLSLLKKRILQSNSSIDPFSAHDIDRSPAKNPSLFERINEQYDLVDSGKNSGISDELKSPSTEKPGISVQNTVSQELSVGGFGHTSAASLKENSNKFDAGNDAGSSGNHINLEDDIRDRNMDEKLSSPNVDETHDDKQMDEEGLPSIEPNANMVDITAGNLSVDPCQLGHSTEPMVEDLAVDELSRTQDRDPEQHEKIHEPAGEPLKEKPKAESHARKQRKWKQYSQRQSLAAAGTSWQAGVRRSTRIRTRPLEYWKGERLLYGRIHESLATVIGLKYESPGKGSGKPTLRVKSYVSDKYKDLVELAALH